MIDIPHGRGVVKAIVDLPFSVRLPNGTIRCIDPLKGHALVEFISREGSTSFNRQAPLGVGPTLHSTLQMEARKFEIPREEHSYLLTRRSSGDTKERSAVTVSTRKGYAEVKPFTEARVFFLTDHLETYGEQEGGYFQRALDVLNPLLDKYSVFAQDYRVHAITDKKPVYLMICNISPLADADFALSNQDILETCFSSGGRTWITSADKGAVNVLQTKNYHTLLSPERDFSPAEIALLSELALTEYQAPLSYRLILEADRAAIMDLDSSLAIVHAETAVEVHMMEKLYEVLIGLGRTEEEAWDCIEAENGTTPRMKALDRYCAEYHKLHNLPVRPLRGTALFTDWEAKLWKPRNRTLHAGIISFSRNDAYHAIKTARRVIAFLESRTPPLMNKLQFDGSMNFILENEPS